MTVCRSDVAAVRPPPNGLAAESLLRSTAGGAVKTLHTTRLLIVLLVAVTAACTTHERPYTEDIGAWQADRDLFMRLSPESPVPEAQRAKFPPLSYFPVNEEYRVPADLRVISSNQVLEMPTSTGQVRKMRRVGTLAFTLKGQPATLTAFVDATENDMRRLFVPFGDLTNGSETYQGGRYLDLDRTATGLYDLDFNRAYHPFCLYNSSYDCPVPPRENRLAIPIRAGERLGAAAH
jgi:uncharacterized protein